MTPSTTAPKRRRGRPPRVAVAPAFEAIREIEAHAAAKLAPDPPPEDPSLRLIPLEGPEMDRHYFGQVTSVSQRRRLIRKGALPCVKVGQRTYISEAAIAAFLRNGGSR